VAAGNGGAVNVSLRIYDVTGREVKALVNEAMQPGKYSVEWDATNNRGNTVAGGIYIYRMVAGDFVATRKMVLLK
jgi:flagellar hook assembly protein FlgD